MLENPLRERNFKMSLILMKKIFESLPKNQYWSIHLLEYKHLKGGSKYTCRLIELEPDGRLNKLIQDISELYTGEKGKKRLSRYNDVRNYDGTCSGTTIYKIPFEESDVVVDLDALFEGITNSDVECNPFEIKPQAYILCGRLLIDGKEHQIKLISMNSPITILKNKFMNKKGGFKEIKEKILNLRTSINAVIYDKDIYMLDMSVEPLFNMERSYKNKCNKAVERIEHLDIVSDIDTFKSIATTGHNPRSFAAFSEGKLNLLGNVKSRAVVCQRFGIPLTQDRKFDTTKKENADKLVKVLCNKAMWDIIEENSVEVDGLKTWQR